jgi:AcrR family transcriptional regulator
MARSPAFPARLRREPAHERSRATVDAILDAAARLLLESGYEKATTNRVAELAGVSVGSLYQYFASKEAIVAELYARHADRMSAEIAAKLGEVIDEPLEHVARVLVRTMIDAHALEPELHRVLMEGAARAGEASRLRDVEHGLWKMARAYLELRRAEIRPENLDVAAFVLVQSVEALTHGAVLHRPELLKDPALVDEICELVLRYLRK